MEGTTNASSETPATQPPTQPPTQASIDTKVFSDLKTLTEKLDLCDSLLRPGGGDPAPSVKADPILLQVIGFLEACAPRMVELVEAGSQGAFSEHVLMECLQANDRLMKCLQDIDTVALTETPASTTAASAAASDLLLSEDSSSSAHAAAAEAATGTKTTGEEDLFAAAPAPAPPAAAATTTTATKDDFDSFFEERTSGGNGS